MDASFKVAAYPGYTTAELKSAVDAVAPGPATERMVAEIARRERAAAGDASVMTDGERLRHAKAVNALNLTPHLDAIDLRLSHERARVAAAKPGKDREWREHNVRQIEREREAEIAFLAARLSLIHI